MISSTSRSALEPFGCSRACSDERQTKLSVSEKRWHFKKLVESLKRLKWYKKVLIMISGGLKCGDWKTKIAIKLKKAIHWLNKYERCTFQSLSLGLCVLPFWKHHLLEENDFPFTISLYICCCQRPMWESTHVFKQHTRRVVNVNWWIDKKIMCYKM